MLNSTIATPDDHLIISTIKTERAFLRSLHETLEPTRPAGTADIFATIRQLRRANAARCTSTVLDAAILRPPRCAAGMQEIYFSCHARYGACFVTMIVRDVMPDACLVKKFRAVFVYCDVIYEHAFFGNVPREDRPKYLANIFADIRRKSIHASTYVGKDKAMIFVGNKNTMTVTLRRATHN